MGNVLNMVGGGGGGIKLLSVAVKTPPNKTQYLPGERFDPAGMVVETKYSNGATLEATGYAYAPDGSLSEGTDSITITYTEGGKSVTAVQPITVERGTVQVPTVSGKLIYTGAEQSPQWTGYDSGKMALGGQTAGVNAGSYTATFTPSYQYKWSDGTTTAKSVSWTIGKAPGKVTVTPSNVVLDKDKPTATVTVERLGDGAVSVSAGGIVSASVSGNTVTIASVGEKSGDAAVTVNVAEGSNYLAASASVGVEAKFAITVGTLAVGSTVKLNVDGSPREFIIVNQGKPSSMYDESCNGTWLLMKDIYENRQWHSSNNNDYENSTIDDYLNGTWFNLLDANIRSVVKQVRLPYRYGAGDNKNNIRSGASGMLTRVFLLSSPEVGFDRGVWEHMTLDGAKLAYFYAGNDSNAQQRRVAKLNGSATDWWLRSPSCYPGDDEYNAVLVHSGGGLGSRYSCSYSYGVRPALILPSNATVDDAGFVQG